MSRRNKVFFASTLEAALGQARRELGPEALLVDAGPADPADGMAGGYRVVCAVEEGAAAAAVESAPPAAAGVRPPWEEIGRRLARLECTLGVVAGTVAGLDPHPGVAALQAELAACDFPPELALRLISAAGERLARQGAPPAADSEASLRACLVEELSARIRFGGLPSGGKRPAMLVFAGPPGAGKTATLVKLAMQEGLSRRRSAAVISTDSHRVAAAEQLRTYAAILGLPFAQAETAAALREAAAEFSSKDLVLVDTPGFSRGDQDWAAEWARLLSALPERQTLLVLPATWRTAELASAVCWWAPFHPAALIFTHLDETECCGGWAAAAIESGLPVAYFCTGQRIPEDMEAASADRLRAALAGGLAKAAAGGGR